MNRTNPSSDAMTNPSRLTSPRRRPRDSLIEAPYTGSYSDQPKAKKLRALSSREEIEGRETPVSLEALTPELFCNVVGFLGATSKSLVSLLTVNKRFRRTMAAIGDAMLPRALSHFRKPLRPKSMIESSTSLFIRHARTCSKILSDLTHLRGVLGREPEAIQGNDVREAMNMALDLLEVAPALSISLERQILSTCGKCGGKVFKYSKWMLRTQESHEHQELLDASRFIMQTVVYRELQLSKQAPSSINSFVQKQIGMKHFESTGCF